MTNFQKNEDNNVKFCSNNVKVGGLLLVLSGSILLYYKDSILNYFKSSKNDDNNEEETAEI
jgi:hypothetical protein